MNPLQPQKAILIIKNNIISVLSLSVKNILEKSCFQDTLDDISIEVNSFLTILEHVIYFCAKGNGLMLSQNMKHHPWKLFVENCTSIPNNCIPTIYQIDSISNNFSKIRAVIRMSLIEKRLHEYLLAAFNNKKLNSKFYKPESIILSGHLPNIINELIGLSAVNFSFDLKLNINHPGFYPIDYSAYLKFYQSPESVLDDLNECNISHGKESLCHWKTNYDKILAKAKLESKQKGYLEEILLNRETKSSALENRNLILESEVKALEISVTDLQVQLTLLHEQYCNEIEKLGGDTSTLIIPSVKSVIGSRAELMSDRHPLARNLSQIESDMGKGDQVISPLPQIFPFVYDCAIRDSYNKLSKMASSTGDLLSQNSSTIQYKDGNDNNNRKLSEKFIVGKQVISEVTQHYYSPSNQTKYKSSTHSKRNNSKPNLTESCTDYSSRLFNYALEEQKNRIMESQELRKIMVKASRSPLIKAHRHAQLFDMTKSMSFDDNYSLDESMTDDLPDSRRGIFVNYSTFDYNHNCTNSHNNEIFPNKERESPNENQFQINSTNYYYLSSAPVSEELNDDDYFNVNSSHAVELVHSSHGHLNLNDNIQLRPPPEIITLPPLVTAEVPQDMEPLTRQQENYRSSDNFVNGDRSSGRPRNSLNED